MSRAIVYAVTVSILASYTASAAPQGYFDLAPGVTLSSGESWSAGTSNYRLYGVQSCLRSTSYTNAQGQTADCGDASLAMFAAYIKDTKPICAAVAVVEQLNYVMCYATIGTEQVDLGTLLISSGFAFAALGTDGLPYNPNYAVAEQAARTEKRGLWQFPDVQHPAMILSMQANHAAAQESEQ